MTATLSKVREREAAKVSFLVKFLTKMPYRENCQPRFEKHFNSEEHGHEFRLPFHLHRRKG